MERPPPGGTRGILRPRTGLERFQIERIPPRAALAPFVANFWVLRWDLRGGLRTASRCSPGRRSTSPSPAT
ncbi:hypothetical protein [Actinomadura madurae]|uniref:hypothetical protein n=1 Tax=Actinomadura madurae TaxID=1993 RepID=UPI0020D20025|nr:hypothetical protein [Actinomadura madurae]MCQ0021336.1 hypothetical protein [Actinomadura madurae]